MPCIIRTKRKAPKRNVTFCNRVVMDNDGHFTSAKRAKASGQRVCQSCMKNWKIKHPPKPRRDVLVSGKLNEPDDNEQKTLIANPDPNRFNSPSFKFGDDELDIVTISKLRAIAYTIAHVKYDHSRKRS